MLMLKPLAAMEYLKDATKLIQDTQDLIQSVKTNIRMIEDKLASIDYKNDWVTTWIHEWWNFSH